jgi:hypothetical protein
VGALPAYRRKRRHRGDCRFGAFSTPNHRITTRGPSLDKGERSGSVEGGNARNDRVRSDGCLLVSHSLQKWSTGIFPRPSASIRRYNMSDRSPRQRRWPTQLPTSVARRTPTIKVRKASGRPLLELHGNAHQFGKTLCVHALHHPGAMVFHGLRTDVELRGDFLV